MYVWKSHCWIRYWYWAEPTIPDPNHQETNLTAHSNASAVTARSCSGSKLVQHAPANFFYIWKTECRSSNLFLGENASRPMEWPVGEHRTTCALWKGMEFPALFNIPTVQQRLEREMHFVYVMLTTHITLMTAGYSPCVFEKQKGISSMLHEALGIIS